MLAPIIVFTIKAARLHLPIFLTSPPEASITCVDNRQFLGGYSFLDPSSEEEAGQA